MFAGVVNPATRRRDSLFSNTLVLPGFNLYEALKVDVPKKLAWKKHLFDFRARHLEQAVLDGADLTKADLYGAHLQGASLDESQLQGAALDGEELQGALLREAQLQGASLDRAQLQRASLRSAQLQRASLAYAQLQGASLDKAQLQGASFNGAGLQGASIGGAHLQGASLDKAQSSSGCVARFCVPSRCSAPLCAASGRIAKALAKELRGLVCESDANALYILRGISGKSNRLADTGREASALVEFIMSKDCPVSAALTDDDKAKLLKIKQDAEKKFPPAPASKKEN